MSLSSPNRGASSSSRCFAKLRAKVLWAALLALLGQVGRSGGPYDHAWVEMLAAARSGIESNSSGDAERGRGPVVEVSHLDLDLVAKESRPGKIGPLIGVEESAPTCGDPSDAGRFDAAPSERIEVVWRRTLQDRAPPARA